MNTTVTKRSKNTKRSFVVSLSVCFLFVSFDPFVPFVFPQQVLDRVVARVGSAPITQTDVDAAVAFGVVDSQAAVTQMIDRRLMLAEVNRFPPPAPSEAAISELVAKMKATAGARMADVMKRTGVDENRLKELARDTLRIQSYIQQRFGNSARSEQQMERWISDLRARGDVAEISPQR